jgi:MFS superfamily sulfate permease-like transporter
LAKFRVSGRELSGALGDMGTFLPLVVPIMKVAGLASTGVLLGFGLFYMASGAVYRLPIPVQPMKAVAAVVLTSHLTPGAIAATGIVLGLLLTALAVSGAMERLARAIPGSVVAGLQLGLGVSLALIAVDLMAGVLWLGLGMVALVIALVRVPGCPATVVALAAAIVVGQAVGLAPSPNGLGPGLSLPGLVLPSLADVGEALHRAVLPQIALTVTNAVIVTAALARTLFPDDAGAVTERRLSLTSGLANLLLAPFGALPMCHGAGGLQAHYRFGARSGAAPLLLGAVLVVLALFFSGTAVQLLAMIPLPAVGALLVLAAIDLAISKRLIDARLDCWPAIAATAVGTVVFDAAVGLAMGCLIEFGRSLGRTHLRRGQAHRD